MLPLEDRELLNQTMLGLNIDPETTSSLMASFDKAAAGVEANPVAKVESASFGDSYTGGYRLGTNVEMATLAVGDAMMGLANGLRGMMASMGELVKDVENTTDQTAATMMRFQQATDCVAPPTFAPAASCTAPTTEEG